MTGTSRRGLGAVTAALATSFAVFAGAGGAAAPNAPPRNTVAPTISGTQRAGETLRANPGTWTGDQPITFSYQWVRCSAQLSNCRNISGATRREYRLTSTDVGRRLVVNVQARNSDGARSAQASTGVIGPRATRPANTAPPTISGTPQEGQTLTAIEGTFTGTQPLTFSYRWIRCDRNGANCADIGGAEAKTYVVSSADVGQTLRVRVAARNSAGAASATSVPTAVIAPAAPPGPRGQIKLRSACTSIPVASVSLPQRLVIGQVAFAPNPVRSRRRPITARVRVVDTRGFVVRGALVFIRSTPLLTSTPPEQATGLDGTVTFQLVPRASFPLRRGQNVQFFVRARKAGDSVLAGVSTRRLVQVRTAAPR